MISPVRIDTFCTKKKPSKFWASLDTIIDTEPVKPQRATLKNNNIRTNIEGVHSWPVNFMGTLKSIHKLETIAKTQFNRVDLW